MNVKTTPLFFFILLQLKNGPLIQPGTSDWRLLLPDWTIGTVNFFMNLLLCRLNCIEGVDRKCYDVYSLNSNENKTMETWIGLFRWVIFILSVDGANVSGKLRKIRVFIGKYCPLKIKWVQQYRWNKSCISIEKCNRLSWNKDFFNFIHFSSNSQKSGQ